MFRQEEPVIQFPYFRPSILLHFHWKQIRLCKADFIFFILRENEAIIDGDFQRLIKITKYCFQAVWLDEFKPCMIMQEQAILGIKISKKNFCFLISVFLYK